MMPAHPANSKNPVLGNQGGLGPAAPGGSLEIENPAAIPLLGIHTEETRRERDTCTPMFITALFIIARTWKQPRCPSADEWISKQWYIYTMISVFNYKRSNCKILIGYTFQKHGITIIKVNLLKK